MRLVAKPDLQVPRTPTREKRYPMHIMCNSVTWNSANFAEPIQMNLVHENGSARPFAVPSLAPPRVRHGGNPCMQCAAKASSTEGARLSDGMRRKCSQIEYFSVQVVRCSGASVEEGVHMHQADYHVKKVWKNVQSSEDCWSLAPRCRAHVTCTPFSEPK